MNEHSLYLVSPLDGKPMLSRGSRSTGLRRCHGPDGPLAGMVGGHLACKVMWLWMHRSRQVCGVVGEEVGKLGEEVLCRWWFERWRDPEVMASLGISANQFPQYHLEPGYLGSCF